MPLLLTTAACTSATVPKPVTAPVSLAWHQIGLPSDPRGRDVVRALTACGSRWYVAGGLLGSDGATAPALWSSTDGRTFTPMRIKTVGAYGPEDILSTVACHGATVVAVGAKSGGAHGNLRTSTWVGSGDGPLTEVAAGFEQYGGEAQIGVGTVAGGGAGFLLVGARVDASGGAGAAVWHSPDGTAFTLVDSDPALESDVRGTTEVDAATVGVAGFLAVGAITPPHSPLAARDPIAWRSSDGLHWTRISLPSSAPDNLLQQVTLQPDGSALAAGADGATFAVWRSDASWHDWRMVGSFGHTTSASGSLPEAVSLVTTPGTGVAAYAVVSDGVRYRLYTDTGTTADDGTHRGGWIEATLPVTVSATPIPSGPRIVVAARTDQGLILGVDDGSHASLWVANLP